MALANIQLGGYEMAPDIAESLRERTPEESLVARDEFLRMVRESTEEEDAAVDEMFRNIRMNLHLQTPDFADVEEESA